MGFYKVSSEYFDTWWFVNAKDAGQAIDIIKQHMAYMTNDEEATQADWDVEYFELKPKDFVERRDL